MVSFRKKIKNKKNKKKNIDRMWLGNKKVSRHKIKKLEK